MENSQLCSNFKVIVKLFKMLVFDLWAIKEQVIILRRLFYIKLAVPRNFLQVNLRKKIA